MSRAQRLCFLAALVTVPVFAAPTETSEKPVHKKSPLAPVTQRIDKSKKQLASPLDAPDTPVDKGHGPINVGPPVELHISKAHGKKFDLRTLPFIPPVKRERPEREEPNANPQPQTPLSATPPQGAAATPPFRAAAAPPPLASFDGLDYANWGAGHPPDTNGDVGPQYYIQTINTSIGVFRKTDGARVAAFTFDTFMSQGSFGNLCDTDNFGDPVVLYDSFEDRWIISDFAFKLDGANNVVNPPGSFQCVAVSMNGDPVSGGWNYYSINTAGGLGDYPKLGIWPDGLYMSANMFNYAASGAFENTRLYAFNKYQMYAGSPNVTVVSFDLPSDQFTVLPANARLQTGTPPPGSPNYFASVWNFLNSIQIWKFHVDWNNISLSSVTGPFDSTSALWWAQFSRSSTTTAPTPANFLDTLYPRLMVQNQYSNLGGVESLWTSHTVGGGATPNPTSNTTASQSAVRYYQVNVTGGTVATNAVQGFTYSPDATVYRYMPSVAVNRAGDMAIGYTKSNAATNPSIFYAGRLAGDPVNSITQTEQLLFAGTGSQSGSCGGTCTRWGDYSAMTLDPDGCTFWYTNEYYVNTGLAFNTRIGSFKFPSCTPVGAGGTVQGNVTATAGGAAIVGATVSLGARSTTTDGSGNYAFHNIPAGTYGSATAGYPGYSTSTSGIINVTDGGTVTQNFSLSSASSGTCYVDTTQADFLAGVPANVEMTSSPGDVKLTNPNVVDQQNVSLSNSGGALATTSWRGQIFKAAVSGKLIGIDVNLFALLNAGSTTPNFTASIRAVSAGVPTGADLASVTMAGFDDQGFGGYHLADFSSANFNVTAGTSYAFIIRPVANPSSPASGPGYFFSVSTGNPYPNGTAVRSTDGGSTWSISTFSGGFHTYVNSGFSASGNLISSIKDGNPGVGNQPNWSTLSWTGVTPANTSLKFQVAASSSVNGPFSFVGPDGTSATFYTTSGASIAQFNGLRYLQYKAILGTTDGTVTPTLNDVTACFADVACPATGAPIVPGNNPVCANAAGMTASVPVGSSNYSWSITNGTITAGSGTPGIIFTAGAGGSVGLQVTYTDATGCVKVSTLAIPIDVPATPTITPGSATTFCAGGSVTLTSSSSSGNQWFLNTVPIGPATNPTFSATASGSYTVQYVDANGCLSPMSAPTVVTVNPNPLATITLSNVQSVAVTGSGTFTLTFNGATTPPISTGATAGAVQAALNALPSIGGVGGSVTVTSSGAYTVTFSGTLGGPQPEMTAGASAGVTVTVKAPPLCSGSSGQASGPAHLAYAWSITNGTITSLTNVQTITYTAGASGDVILNLTVTDGNDCSASSAPADVPIFPAPAVPNITATTNATGTTDQACPEVPLTLTANGAPSAVSYQWYQDNNTLNGSTSSTYQAVAVGTYYVTETDANGCTSPQSAGYVVQNPTPHSPFISFRNQDSSVTTLNICQGSSQIIDSDSATGIQWYEDSVAIPTGGNNQSYTFISSTPGTHTFTAQLDALGCHSQFGRTVTIIIDALPPTPTIIGDTNATGTQDQACPEQPLTLHANGATGATSYTWYSDNAVIPNETTSTLIMTGVGNISVTATNGTCTTPHSATYVVQNPTPHSPFISFRNQASTVTTLSICQGSSQIIDSDSATGIQWYKDGLAIPGAGNQSYTATQSGVYTAQLNALGCHSQFGRNVTLTVNPLPPTPTVNAGGPTTFCAGGSVTLTSSSATGNQWLLDGNPIGGATNTTYNATLNGNYSVTVTGGNGCTATSAATAVTVNPLPATPTITSGGPTSFCTSGSVTLTSSSATGNQWLLNGAPIGAATSQTYIASASGDYSVKVTDANGCTATSAVTTVTVNPNPNATITAPGSVTTGSTGNSASVASAGAGATYNWSITNGAITGGTGTQSITFTAGAVGTLTLQVTVTTSAGCADTKSANVNVGVPAVTVTSVSPSSGSINGHTAVTVNGTGFATGATVKFGGTAATSVVVVSATKITAITPAHLAGAVNVTVTNTDTSTAALTNGYTYAQLFDPNGDHTIDPSDIFYLINYLFLHGPAPIGGIAAGDANGDGMIDPSDIFYLVNYLFLSGPQPYAEPVAHAASVSAPLRGSISLGEPVLRGDRYVIPVVVDGVGAAMSLRLRFDGAGSAGATIQRAAGLQPAFEVSRHDERTLSYLVAYAGAMHGVVAEIEVPAAAAARGLRLDVDPDMTLLCDRDGIRKATVAGGTLTVSGTSIDGDRSRTDKPRSEK
jgi:hypothetical protein